MYIKREILNFANLNCGFMKYLDGETQKPELVVLYLVILIPQNKGLLIF